MSASSVAKLYGRDEQPEGYVLGTGLFRQTTQFRWDPDEMANPHMLIWGGSGSGKSRFLRQLTRYLRDRHKHVYLVDVHGDLGVEGENCIQIGERGSTVGINPFALDTHEHGGPAAQASEIIRLFKKTYLRRLGPVQEMIVRQLIIDTYRRAGVVEEDRGTWFTPSGQPKLVSMRDLQRLIEVVRTAIQAGMGEFAASFQRLGREIEKTHAKLQARDEQDSFELEEKMRDLRAELGERFSGYLEYRFMGGEEPGWLATEYRQEMGSVDLQFYLRKNAQPVVETLGLYVDALVEHGVFVAEPPPVKPGLNRFLLTALDDTARVFFTEAMAYKIFRAVRNRGEYRRLPRRPRGRAVDTYLILDEAQTLLPTDPRNLEDRGLIYNRIVAEARKFGLGLILVTQSPAAFSKSMFSNVAQRVGLRTNASDVPAAKRCLGLRDDAIFKHLARDGVGAVSTPSGEYHSVVLNWER